MNKVFKIVFNAARGKMMVVNEATSSVQTGKKAAVTVAVATALMLGANVSVAKVIGGDDLSYEAEAPAEFKDVLTLDVTENTDEVISGHYFGINNSTTYLQGAEKTFVLKSTTTNIESKVKIEEGVYAGSKVAGGYPDIQDYVSVSTGTLNLKTASTNLTIDAGEFGTYSGSDAEIAMRHIITAGDFVKDRGSNYKGKLVIATTIDNANMSINGGTFHSTVFGGSVLANYTYDNVDISSSIEKSNVTITGGTFEAPVFAGGAAMNLYGDHPTYHPYEGSQITSIVKQSNLVIQGGDFQQGIYTGGLEGYINEVVEVVPHADVDVANVTVLNSDVSKISGYNVKGVISSGNWAYTNLDAVNTNLKVINSSVGTIDIAEGSVELRAEGKDGKTSVGTLSVEGATVSLTADGEANEASGGDITKVIDIDFESVAGATVAMAEGMYQGAVTGTIGEDGKAVVTQATNSVMSNTLDLASAAPLAMNRLLMNDVRKRMGDLRAAEGTHGVWARYDGGKLSGANGLENDFTTVQVGIDTVPVADAPRFGVAFAYTKSDADMKRGGAEMDAFSLAFYGTKFYDNGMFVDVIGRMATADTDVNVEGKTGTMDNVALSLSGELGWRFDVTEKFYFEPQAELTYTYVNADKLALSSGHEYEFDSVDSLMARVGFAAGFKCPNNFGDVYVRASAVHEFLGDAAVTGTNGTSLPIDGEDTWVEFGLGANFNINKNTYVYADIERTEGAKLEEDWRANVGVRFAF